MSAEFNYSPTGYDFFDSLKGLQKIASEIIDPDHKIERVRKTLGIVMASKQIEKQFMVISQRLFIKNPDESPDSLKLYDREFMFIGQLDTFSYMFDEDVPVDSLVLNFINNDVIGADEKVSKVLRTMTLQVPILALESCVEAA